MKLSRRNFLKGSIAVITSIITPSIIIAEPDKTLIKPYRYIKRTGLPKCTWRKLNEGIPTSKTTVWICE